MSVKFRVQEVDSIADNTFKMVGEVVVHNEQFNKIPEGQAGKQW